MVDPATLSSIKISSVVSMGSDISTCLGKDFLDVFVERGTGGEQSLDYSAVISSRCCEFREKS